MSHHGEPKYVWGDKSKKQMKAERRKRMAQKTEWTKAISLGYASPGMIAVQKFSDGEIVLISRHTNQRPVDPKFGIIEIELPVEIPEEGA